jgi:glycosyltransferase involved in cell wall biosynthesis
LALVTDAWLPQVNGVTTTLKRCVELARDMGHQVRVIHPAEYRTIPCPRYPHICLALWPGRRLVESLDSFAPTAIHVATEGPLGIAARRYCRRRGLPFTTAFHTKFHHYLKVYAGIPVTLTLAGLRRFHGAATRTFVPTASVRRELSSHGFTDLVQWTRGVDADLFRPDYPPLYDLPRPIFLYAGRVASEKNIEAFLDAELPGSKVVVGDGPARPSLERRHPAVHWAGFRFGEDLARHYADADVFVFPSRTDTFGVVMLEANASGLPVAAFPVPGPNDVIVQGQTGVLDEDLSRACLAAAELDGGDCRRYALDFTWQRCAEILLDNLEVFSPGGSNQAIGP